MTLTRRAVIWAMIAAPLVRARARNVAANDDVDYGEFAPPELRLTLRLSDAGGGEPDDALIEQMIAVLTERATLLDVVLIHLDRLTGSDVVLSLRDVDDVDLAIETLSRRGLLEIIDPQGVVLAAGSVVATSLGGAPPEIDAFAFATPQPIYRTILSNADLADAFVSTDELGAPVVVFRLRTGSDDTFHDYTSKNVGKPISIVVDNVVVSSPVINAAISGEGLIQGMPPEEVFTLVIQLNSEPLPGRIKLLDVDRRD